MITTHFHATGFSDVVDFHNIKKEDANTTMINHIVTMTNEFLILCQSIKQKFQLFSRNKSNISKGLLSEALSVIWL